MSLKDIVLVACSSVAANAAATGTLLFTGQPSANDTITVGGQKFTFITGSSTTTAVQIKGSLSLTLDELVTVLNASVLGTVSSATYSKTSTTTLTITYDTTGFSGNQVQFSFSFATQTGQINGATAATSGSSTLSGGTVTLTGQMGSKSISINGDGSVSFTDSAGRPVTIVSEPHFQALLKQIATDDDLGLPRAYSWFGSPAVV